MNIRKHQTIAYPRQDGGWLFVCTQCGYRARLLNPKAKKSCLEILSLGNRYALHDNFAGPLSEPAAPPEICVLDVNVEDSWLTPELRQQIYAIIEKLA